jgi:hypothetical protein
MASKKKGHGGRAGGGNKQGASKKKQAGGRNFPITTVVIAVVVVLGAGIGIAAWQLTGDSSGVIELPKFAYAASAPARAPEAYQAALDIPDYLEQIPCYCGCAIDGHQNNLDCFIKSRQGDKVEWDDHAAG